MQGQTLITLAQALSVSRVHLSHLQKKGGSLIINASMHQEEKKRKGESLSPQCITKRKSVPLNEVSMMEIEADLGEASHCFGIF